MNKFLILLLTSFLWACNGGEKETTSTSTANIEKDLQTKLINAQEGDLIEIPEGRFNFTRTLSLDGVSGVTIKGAGMDKTILSFKGQIDGAEGLSIKADGITLEGFTVEDTKGDAIKISNSKDVTMRKINTTWTDGAKETNGGLPRLRRWRLTQAPRRRSAAPQQRLQQAPSSGDQNTTGGLLRLRKRRLTQAPRRLTAAPQRMLMLAPVSSTP